MKKVAILFVFVLIMLFSAFNVSGGKTNPLADLVYQLQAKVEELTTRVTNLEGKVNSFNRYYTREFGQNNASQGMAVTVMYGCDEGDVAISGGLSEYQGSLNNWRTIRNVPSDSQYNNHGWITTVINEVQNGTFSVRVKCLDLN